MWTKRYRFFIVLRNKAKIKNKHKLSNIFDKLAKYIWESHIKFLE